MEKKLTDLQRRRFLLTAGAGGTGAAVIVAGIAGRAMPTPAETSSEGTGGAKSGGYSETAHVRNYYRTTRI